MKFYDEFGDSGFVKMKNSHKNNKPKKNPGTLDKKRKPDYSKERATKRGEGWDD